MIVIVKTRSTMNRFSVGVLILSFSRALDASVFGSWSLGFRG